MIFKVRRNQIKNPWVIFLIAILSFFVAGVIIFRLLDFSAFKDSLRQASNEPAQVIIALGVFFVAFLFRAIAWKKVLPSISLGQSLAGIHLSLGANHVLPLRLGEPFRILSIIKRSNTSLDAATASTVTLRSADILSVIIIGIVVAPSAFSDLLGWIGWLLVSAIAIVAIGSWRWLKKIVQSNTAVRLPGPLALGLSASAWLLESVLVWQCAHWAGLDVSWNDALLVTTVAVAAQIAAIAPGGFGTYEAAAVAAYVALGYDADTALVASLTAHALKTSYSLLVGGLAMVTPKPSLIGRFRLQKTSELLPETPLSENPVLLFLPAFNEEAAVADCIQRVPTHVCGLAVQCLIVDDGSIDRTAEFAEHAGAEVLSLEKNQGLGAAVRIGLSEGVRRNASAVVFADADGEYPPEELENLVGPILEGKADYVVGSRFLGDIEFMRPHRRFGNLVLTRILSVIARRRITDGQSGYRAFSPRAAKAAEVIHDFNYAQIITLDLLAKGFIYLEVPISYHFRTTGESFIKLFPYLRKVVPAVYKELNTV
ncbi:MAG: hypothetical protein CL454_09285 [Acidimicrobiaceae bacterium]|nr:hypothetical protein [Acidimicrobiaceae bacterium]MBC85037.1 hypothetical protein [Acidimicrobiaceae bacterium]|tara:strand:- start:946 stop:2568 length:1623 start_codon:yes stop_codon:yes gene_type:complete